MLSCESTVDRCFLCLLRRRIAGQQRSGQRSSRHSAVSSRGQSARTVPLTLRLAFRQRDAIVARFTERVGSLRSWMSASESTPSGGIVARADNRLCRRKSWTVQKGAVGQGGRCAQPRVTIGRRLSVGPFREVCQQTGRHHSNHRQWTLTS